MLKEEVRKSCVSARRKEVMSGSITMERILNEENDCNRDVE